MPLLDILDDVPTDSISVCHHNVRLKAAMLAQ